MAQNTTKLYRGVVLVPFELVQLAENAKHATELIIQRAHKMNPREVLSQKAPDRQTTICAGLHKKLTITYQYPLSPTFLFVEPNVSEFNPRQAG